MEQSIVSRYNYFLLKKQIKKHRTKEDKKKYSREYYQKNKEKLKLYYREYYRNIIKKEIGKKNEEIAPTYYKYRRVYKKYYRKNKEKRLNYQKEYYLSHKKERNEYSSKYYENIKYGLIFRRKLNKIIENKLKKMYLYKKIILKKEKKEVVLSFD